jgi:Initiator Replication protein
LGEKYVGDRAVTISLEELRRVLGLESVKNAEGKVIKEAPLPIWANFRQRALDVAILEINAKTDLKIKLVSIERADYRRVVALDFAIKTQPIPKSATRLK